MNFLRFVIAAALAGFLFAAPRCAAQAVTGTSGAINGTVTDSSGAVLSGVSVALSGPTEMVSPTTTTDQNGSFRFAAVPPGDYSVKFTMNGFNTVTREGIHVGVGFVATVDIQMHVGSVNESITVSESGPVIDTTNTVVSTQFDTGKLTDLPGSRDVWGVLAQTPAVAMAKPDVGGNGALNQQVYTAYGLSASVTGTNRNDVEGIRVGAANGSSDNYFADYGSFSEIAVQTVGGSAEVSNPGTLQQYVSKSGGNQYHGDVYYDYENKAMEAVNIDNSQIAAGVAGSKTLSVYDTNRLSKFSDFDGDLGGYAIKDKLWWYGAFRYTSVAQAYPWLTDTAAPIDNPVETAKVTFNLTPRNRFVGYYQHENVNQPDYTSAGGSLPIETSDAVEGAYFPVTVWKVEYDATISKSLYLEVRYGAYLSGYRTYNKSTAPRIADTGLNTVSGACCVTGLTRNRPQGNVTLSYVTNFWGSHTIKGGGEIWVDHLISPFGGEGDSCDCVSTLVNNVPSTVQIYQGTNVSKNDLWTYAWYVNDTWQVKPRLTLSLGIRLDRYKPELPDQTGPAGQQFSAASNFVTFDNWAPRVGIAYALDNGRKNVIKVHYGEYFLYPGVNFSSAFNPNPSGWSQTYKWSDPNHIGSWQPGQPLGTLTASSGGTTATKLAPNIKNTYFNEASAYYERELAANFGLRTGFVWYGERQLYGVVNANLPLSAFSSPMMISVPGPNGAAGGTTVTGYNVATSYVGITPVNTEENIPGTNNAFYTWEITAMKRQVGRWSMLASFAKTWSHLSNYGNVGSLSTTFNPNGLINTNGGFNNFSNWQSKVSATGDLPLGFRVIPTLRFQSGTPFGRYFTGTFNYGTTLILAEPWGTERTPNIALFDTRIEKEFHIKDRYLASAFFDVYNIFNNNADQTVTESSGASFLRPTAITGPRILRVGAKFSF